MSTLRSIRNLPFLKSNFLRDSRHVRLRGRRTSGLPLRTRSRAMPRLEPLEERMMLTTFNVISNSDANTGINATTGTLRYVLNQLDTVGGSANVISFASLPAADFTFTPGSALPTITRQVTIEGNTAPGFSGAPLIQISGGSAGSGVSGLVLGNGSSGSVVESLVINQFSTDGLYISSSNDSVIGCYIGTDLTGETEEGNQVSGIVVANFATGATIGGTSPSAANVISGNWQFGIFNDASSSIEGNVIGINAAGTAPVPNDEGIFDLASGATIGGTSSGDANIISGNSDDGIIISGSNCLVVGNLIGTNAAGTAAVPNAGCGVLVDAQGATIGGTSSGDANIISGNGSYGVLINAPCLVAGNLIGTNAAGTAAVPNAVDGVLVDAPGATIGGTSPGAANIISGNEYGVYIDAPCRVEGNLIGTNAAGTAAVRNTFDGIDVVASGVTIGGTSAGAANIISGNTGDGVDIYGSNCLVEGNLIGTNAAGTAAVPNTVYGVNVSAEAATIGGTSPGDANIISGNAGDGVVIGGSNCVLEGNLIGTNATGTAAVANGVYGIAVVTPDATIGGTSASAANIISGNGGGVIIDASPCLVEGNLIGTNQVGTAAVGNTSAGILVAASGATIGGTSAGAGNIIAFNGGPGVATLPGVTGTTIRYNAIYSNVGPGIDRNNDGVTPNTPNGANNTPVLTSVAGGFISGTLNAAPDSSYILDFYANLTSDASPTRPQGRDYLASTPVMTNAAGDAVFNVSYTPFPGLPIFTAAATDAAGTTSEFSPPLGYALAATGATFAATTGVAFQGTVASFTSSDPAATAAEFTATINYGDSTTSAAGTVVAAPGGFIVVGSHTYTTANPATPVTVMITDTVGGSQATANSLANVTNLLKPVSQPPVFVAGTLESAVVASFTDGSRQAFPGQFTAMINWGDNTGTSPGVVSADGKGFDVTGSHTYNFSTTSTVTEPVTVTITDTLTGATATANSTATVDPAPITIQTKDFAVKGGVLFSGKIAAFTDSDPRIDPKFYTATINWGDGSANSTGVITGTNPFTVTSSHTFAPFQNIDLVTITVTDRNGRTVTGVDRVVDPPAVLDIEAGGLTLSAHKPFVGTVATFTDTGPAEPATDYKATINWGKGRKAAGMITGSNGQFVVSGKRMFSRLSGAKTVSVTVTDITDGRTVSVDEPASYVVRHPKVSAAKRPVMIAVKPHRA